VSFVISYDIPPRHFDFDTLESSNNSPLGTRVQFFRHFESGTRVCRLDTTDFSWRYRVVEIGTDCGRGRRSGGSGRELDQVDGREEYG
jgi:hypothetical protein